MQTLQKIKAKLEKETLAHNETKMHLAELQTRLAELQQMVCIISRSTHVYTWCMHIEVRRHVSIWIYCASRLVSTHTNTHTPHTHTKWCIVIKCILLYYYYNFSSFLTHTVQLTVHISSGYQRNFHHLCCYLNLKQITISKDIFVRSRIGKNIRWDVCNVICHASRLTGNGVKGQS